MHLTSTTQTSSLAPAKEPSKVVIYGTGAYQVHECYYDDIPWEWQERHHQRRKVASVLFDPKNQVIEETAIRLAIPQITSDLLRSYEIHRYPVDNHSAKVSAYHATLIYDQYGHMCFGDIIHAFDNLAAGHIILDDHKTYGRGMDSVMLLQLIKAQSEIIEVYRSRAKARERSKK